MLLHVKSVNSIVLLGSSTLHEYTTGFHQFAY